MTHPAHQEGIVPWSRARAWRLARFVAVDATLQELKRCRERITPALGRSCTAFVNLRAWKFFGDARLSDHAPDHFGRTSRWVRDLAAIGRGLNDLPGFEGALQSDLMRGKPLGRTTAARLARIATPESFEAWLALARRTDARQFAAAVSKARSTGSEFPPDPGQSTSGSGASADPSAGTDIGGSTGGVADAVGDHDDDGENDVEIRLFVPAALQLGFEDALELHRAVSGGQVSVRDFVEALAAEALSGAVPAEIDLLVPRPGPSRSDVERHMARKARGWPWLNETAGFRVPPRSRRRSRADRNLEETCQRLVTEACRACAQLGAVAGRAGSGKADDLHRQIRELLELDDAIERCMGQLLGWISRHRACADHLFNGVGHYAEQRLGMGRREAQLRAAVDRRLPRFPLLRAAYERGDLGLEAVAVVLRILYPGPVNRLVEAAWLKHAQQVSTKRLRDEARLALREWLEAPDDQRPMPFDDETWLRSLTLFPGTTQRRLRRLVEDARPGHRKVEVGTTLSVRLSPDVAHSFLGALEDRRLRVGDGLATAPSATRLAQLFSGEGRPSPPWVGLLALLEEYVDTWDAPEMLPKRRFNRVYALWGWRCAAPGCTRRCGIEAHHLLYLSHGGPLLDMSNLVALCSFHHRQGEHGLLASCRGKAPLGIVWRMGHPSVGRWLRNERLMRAEAIPLQVAVA